MRVLVWFLAMAAVCGAQTKQERAKQVIDAALAALGGDKFLAMRDRVEAGRAYSFYHERLSGLSRATIYTRYLGRPEPPVPGTLLVRERQSFGKDEQYGAVLFTADQGYQITFRGARPLPAETVARFRDSTLHNIFYILRQRRGEPGLIFESQGSDIVDNQPADIVDVTDADNRTVTVSFHQTTRLPIRQLYYRRDPKTRERNEEVTIYSKYREVSGIQWPFSVQRLRNGEQIFQIYSDTVEIDKGLTDELFTLPANMKLLKPEK